MKDKLKNYKRKLFFIIKKTYCADRGLFFGLLVSIVAGIITPLAVNFCTRHVIHVLESQLFYNLHNLFIVVGPYILLYVFLITVDSYIPRYLATSLRSLGLKLSDLLKIIVIDKIQKIHFYKINNSEFQNIYAEILRLVSHEPNNIIYSLLEIVTCFLSLIFYLLFLIKFNFINILLLIFNIPLFIYEIKTRNELYSIMKSQIENNRYGFYCMDVLCQSSYVKETRTSNLYDYFMSMRDRLSETCIKQICLFGKKEKRMSICYKFLANISIIFILGYSLNGFLKKEIFLADIVWLIGMISSFRFSATNLSKAISINYSSMILIDHIFKILDIETEINTKKKLPKINKRHVLEFKNVYFKYPGSSNYAIENISFKICTGNKIAIIGENGSGKSTIINLILRIYSPEKGAIYLDGINIEDYDLHEFYKIFGVLFQDFCKYSVSIKDCITFDNFNETRFKMAIHDSLSEEFIEKLPEKHNTLLTHLYKRSGCELSGGQWQRLAIARLFFKNSDILLLDEPNSYLDPLTEKEIFYNLNKCNGKIVLSVTHKLLNLKNVDEIILLDNGRILAKGTHDFILNTNLKYKEMYELQVKSK